LKNNHLSNVNRYCCFKCRKICPTGNCALFIWQKNKISAPTMCSQWSRFHPNRFTFGGVI